jgi:signal transduction histidine kinase
VSAVAATAPRAPRWARSGAVAVGLGALVAAGQIAWLVGLSTPLGATRTVRDILLASAFVAAGVIAATRGRAPRIGALLVGASALTVLGEAGAEHLVPWRYTVGQAAWLLEVPLLAWAVLAFPTNRLGGWWPRTLVGVLFALTWGWQPFSLAWSPPGALCATCPPAGNLLYVGHEPPGFSVEHVGDDLIRVAIAVVALVLITLVVRAVRSSRPGRRILAPVVVPAVLLAAKLLLDYFVIVPRWVHYPEDNLVLVQSLNTLIGGALAAGLAVGFTRAAGPRSGVGRLVVELGRMPAGAPLTPVLARALGDPGLQVGFWADRVGGYVDAQGDALVLPQSSDARVASFVAGSSGPLAVLLHDRALTADPGRVEAVGSAARLALENERLQAEVRGHLAEVTRSRARIVEAADEERRRIERDLHDGAQQRLVSMAMALQLLRGAVRGTGDADRLEPMVDEARQQAELAIAELRDLARGIHPPVLSEEGLDGALGALADAAPVDVELLGTPGSRLDPGVEAAAYFLCAEAITNAAKHAGCERVTIDAHVQAATLMVEVRDDGAGGAHLEPGGGLRGLADRVDALGGTLEIDSARGAGTALRARLPAGGLSP